MGEDIRVALVVVHGIADQRSGQTVRELARLLCHGSDGDPRFIQGELDEVLVPVAKLEPGSVPQADRSHQRKPGSPSGFYQNQQGAEVASSVDMATAASPRDFGLELNDYLLGRLELSEGDALYESTRVSLRRRADNRVVDLYEMYWADLSRLGEGGLKALSSLYQLFCHLSTLSADVVDQLSLSTNGGRAWRLLQRLHAWMAWLMKAPAVIVQLCLLLLVLFGTTAFIPEEQHGQLLSVAFGLGGGVLCLLAALSRLRETSVLKRWLKPLLLLAVALGSFTLALTVLLTDLWSSDLYFGACALATGLLGAYVIERYARMTQGVRIIGHLLVLATVVMLGLEAKRVVPYVTTLYEWMVTAAMGVGELLFAAMLLVWAVFFSVLIVALLLGWRLGRTGTAQIAESLHTARLVLVLSTGFFVVLSLLLWSVISSVAGYGLDVGYEPLVFGDGYWPSAASFLNEGVRGLGGFFTPLLVASLLLGFAGLLVLAPALMEELSPSTNIEAGKICQGASQWSGRLGHWLGSGMGRLGKVFKAVVPLGALAGALLYLAFVFQKTALSIGVEDGFSLKLVAWLDYLQGETLVSAGKWVAGGALTIAALGSRFTQTFGRLRVVIDAVLDVDNYFSDPPNRQPPRARIFSRYASLLTYLRDKGYTRIVIVSHSQGTVISAELLHYLHAQGRLQDFVGKMPVALVTMGSPLRDLYATRFPLLYGWMGSPPQDFAAAVPEACDLGISEWVNAYRSGDYVGRCIWTAPDDVSGFDVATVDAASGVVAKRAGDRTEFCLGAGAHTHYFSNDAVALAAELDRLVTGDSATS